MSVAAMLVLARVAGFLARAPGFSHPAVPHLVRGAFACATAAALVHGVAPVEIGAGAFAFALLAEFALGAMLGQAAAAFYDGALAAGRLLDDYAGIRIVIPTSGVTGGGFGRLYGTLFVAVFVLARGYAPLIDALAGTLRDLPPGTLPAHAHLLSYALALPGLVVRAALATAGPALLATFSAQALLGVLQRVVPRASTFMLSFPLSFGAALATVVTLAPAAARMATHLHLGPWRSLAR
ncbi:MAG: flagellar biosynthetic protein FliR [bacterium]|nr:flagellar biosynthetic protein FliR [bacterium]